MKIKRYIGNNTQEAMLKVKMDLGSEAVILNTRKVRQKGFFKMFAKPMVEILAAVDDDIQKKKAKGNETNKNNNGSNANVIYDESEKKIAELETKFSNMEDMLNKIYEKLKVTESKVSIVEEGRYSAPSKVLQMFYNNLVKHEVEVDVAKRIVSMVSENISDKYSVNDVAAVLYNVLCKVLGKPETIKLRNDNKPTVVIFIGPTGVGKTTTLAKIAANYALYQKKNVGLITADTYRIAAVDQLKTYAEILGMPVTVVYSPEEIENAVNSHSDKDIILIDTAGRSYKNKNQFEELKKLIDGSKADEVFLVLSSTISVKNCREIINNYSFLKDYKLIFTKLDETPTSGVILNAKCITNKSLSYFTTGQNVPDDIEVANVDRLAKNLLGSINA